MIEAIANELNMSVEKITTALKKIIKRETIAFLPTKSLQVCKVCGQYSVCRGNLKHCSAANEF